eukprot:Skav232783  [mRNA]  locus=scaffold614:171061:171555:- [translate_table: standard]
MRSLRVISSARSESALVGIHGRAELSASDESESNSAPPLRGFPGGVLNSEAPHSCSRSSSEAPQECFLELSPDGRLPVDAQELAGKCNPFTLSRAIQRKWRERTIWSMLSRIDEIPEQVEGMLTQTASDLSMQVDGGVVQMQDLLREASPTGEQVAETLEMLPR